MQAMIVQPKSSQKWTGGYLYNEQIASFAKLQTISLAASDLPAAMIELAKRANVFWDSLYIYNQDFAESYHLLQKPYFLIHHLQSLDLALSHTQRQELRLCEEEILAQSAGLITTGHSIRSLLVQRFPKLPIVCCPPGIDQQALASARSERHKFLAKAPTGPLKVLTVGHLIERKGFVPGLRLLAELATKVNWQWTIIGDTTVELAYAEKFDRELERLQLHGKVNIWGLKSPPEILKLMAGFDLFFFPSLFESYGMVVMEALSVGLPVLARDQGEMPNLISSPAHGICFEDVPKFDEIAAWMSDRKQLQNYGWKLLSTDVGMGWQEAAKVFQRAAKELCKSSAGTL